MAGAQHMDWIAAEGPVIARFSSCLGWTNCTSGQVSQKCVRQPGSTRRTEEGKAFLEVHRQLGDGVVGEGVLEQHRTAGHSLQRICLV